MQRLAAGYSHTCALLMNGKVRCWGEGELGSLGYGNRNDIGDDETPAMPCGVSRAPFTRTRANGART